MPELAPERHDPVSHCYDEMPAGGVVHVCAMPDHSAHVLHMCRCGFTWDEESIRDR